MIIAAVESPMSSFFFRLIHFGFGSRLSDPGLRGVGLQSGMLTPAIAIFNQCVILIRATLSQPIRSSFFLDQVVMIPRML
jgi:hypothetical protein